MKTRYFFSALFVLTLFVLASPAQVASSTSANLALTPPMGWNSWNKFQCNVSEDMIKGMADAVVKSGMKDAGYVYVNIDDCWQVSRDQKGNIVIDAQRFPSWHESARGLYPLARTEIRCLFRCGVENLRGASRRAGPRISGCDPICGLGSRLLEVRLVPYQLRRMPKASYANMRAALTPQAVRSC